MQTKIFGDKKITIRKTTKLDLKNAKKFQVFINSLIKEEAKILMNKKLTLKEEKEFLERMLKGIKDKIRVFLVAEHDGKIVGTTSIELNRWRKNHIGNSALQSLKVIRE